MNFIEQLPILITIQLIAGVVYPTYIASLGFGYVVARVIYSLGYLKCPIWRFPGALLMNI